MSNEEEEKYFKIQESARREAVRREMERAAKEAAEKRRLAATVGTDDDALVARMRDLGFDGDSARVFDILPLIHVAWADGSVSAKERRSIFDILERRGVEPGSEASVLVETLLEQRPSQDFLDETLDIIRGLGGDRGASIVDLCMQVARASGGFLGLGDKVSDEEYGLIGRIAEGLGESAQRAFKAQL